MRHLCIFLSITGLTALAQTDRGTITGTVLDPAGAVIAGAMIQAKNQATGAVYSAATSDTGNYSGAGCLHSWDRPWAAPGMTRFKPR
jgi:Carboxypeptidase regulatory-like domain